MKNLLSIILLFNWFVMTAQVNENGARLTVAEYCPDMRNAKLLAFGGRSSNILYIAQVEYAFPYLS